MSRIVLSAAQRSRPKRRLARSISSGVPMYDTLFVELAEREGLAMVTFHDKV